MGFEVCRDVFVKGDDILEPDEAFNVILETVDSDDTLSSLSFRVEIEDDGDGEGIKYTSSIQYETR